MHYYMFLVVNNYSAVAFVVNITGLKQKIHEDI